uniref:Uncharacterized protein n=1 Tax=Strongyloides venezuelensis TaxID=75913 RepID=A0A0K0EXD9_STRVS
MVGGVMANSIENAILLFSITILVIPFLFFFNISSVRTKCILPFLYLLTIVISFSHIIPNNFVFLLWLKIKSQTASNSIQKSPIRY